MVILKLNIRLKGYIYRQHQYTVERGNGSATTSLLREIFPERHLYLAADFTRLNFTLISKHLRLFPHFFYCNKQPLKLNIRCREVYVIYIFLLQFLVSKFAL